MLNLFIVKNVMRLLSIQSHKNGFFQGPGLGSGFRSSPLDCLKQGEYVAFIFFNRGSTRIVRFRFGSVKICLFHSRVTAS